MSTILRFLLGEKFHRLKIGRQIVRLTQNNHYEQLGWFSWSSSRRKSFEEKKADLNRRREQVTAKVKQAKSLAKQRINIYRENVMTIPNFLSVARIAATPLLGYWVCVGSYTPALSLFTFAAISDLLDGQIARRWPSQRSMIGTLLDPLADKLLVGTLFFTLTYAELIPLPLTGLIIFRDAGLVAASFYLRFKSLPEPKTLSRYFDPSLASMKFEPTFLSKTNTSIQLGLVAISLAAPVFGFVEHTLLKTLWWVTASTTATSALEYLIRKDTYKFFKTKK